MLAKIAYCAVVAIVGLENIEEAYILQLILDEEYERDDIGMWIGCNNFSELEQINNQHIIRIFYKGRDAIVSIRLFADYNAPDYLVVVGRINEEYFKSHEIIQ